MIVIEGIEDGRKAPGVHTCSSDAAIVIGVSQKETSCVQRSSVAIIVIDSTCETGCNQRAASVPSS